MEINIEKTLCSLIEFDTVKPEKKQDVKKGYETLDKSVEYVKEVLQANTPEGKIHFEQGKAPNNTPYLIATFNNEKEQEYFLVNHIDVVGPDNKDHFKPEIKDGKVYGRGSADMKGGLVASIDIMQKLAHLDSPPNVGMIITSDEETSGEGADYVCKQKYKCDLAIFPEPRNSDKPGITTKEKGLYRVILHYKGKSAHASTKWDGENAIDKMRHHLNELEQIFPDPTKEDNWHTSLNIYATANDAKNLFGKAQHPGTVPSTAIAGLEFRLTEDYDLKTIKSIIDRGSISKREDLLYIGMLDTDENNPKVQALKKHFNQYGPFKTLGFSNTNGQSDATIFSENGIPSINFGPKGHGPHSEDEHISLNEIKKYSDVMYDFFKNGK